MAGFRATFFVYLFLLVLVSGCERKPEGMIWKEEIRLMNGDLIVADRRNLYGTSGDRSNSRAPHTDSEIRFTYKGKRYEWVQHGLTPVALQEDAQGRMVIVSTLQYCWAWAHWGRPDSFYVVHRYEAGKWNRVDISDIDQGSVFNLAGGDNDPGVYEHRDYVPETAWKFKDDTFEPSRHIAPGRRSGGC